jgi:GT2 family glycosyltransferase
MVKENIKSKVCVVTSYYNNFEELYASVKSIGSDDVSMVIVDDGSFLKLTEFQKNELSLLIKGNIFHLVNEINVGIPKSLNRAIDIIFENGYEYYCRLDSGDEFLPGKIGKQLSFMDDNPDYVLVGSYAKIKFGNTSKLWKVPVQDSDIRKGIYFGSPYIHSTCMIRVDCLKKIGGYDESFFVAQDYELISRLLDLGKLFNIPEPLIIYDYSTKSISTTKRKLQIKNRLIVQSRMFDYSFFSYLGIIKTLIVMNLSRDLITFIKFPFRKNTML